MRPMCIGIAGVEETEMSTRKECYSGSHLTIVVTHYADVCPLCEAREEIESLRRRLKEAEARPQDRDLLD